MSDTKPRIKLKSITVNDTKPIAGGIKARQTATLVFSVFFGDNVQSLELSLNVPYQEDQVAHTVDVAQRTLLQKFQELSAVLEDKIHHDSQT